MDAATVSWIATYVVGICYIGYLVIAIQEGFAPHWIVRAWSLVKRLTRGRPAPEPFNFEQAYQRTMEIPVEGEPLYSIEAWTPEEREILGVNDTMRFISDFEDRLHAADKHRQGRAIRRGQFTPAADEAPPLRRKS